MNILKRELRAGLKPFIFWMIGMFLLVFAGIAKFQGVSAAGPDITALLASFPRIVLAVLGIVGVDINTLGGYTAILFYYVLICAVIYAVHLGSGAVSRESVDKTYEFVFSKPCSRVRVLLMKLLAGWLYLLVFSVMTLVFSLAAVSTLNTSESIAAPAAMLAASVFLTGSLFIALSAFFAAAAKRPEKGSLFGNLAFLWAFVLGVICNMLEHPGILRIVSPFSYFIPADLVSGSFDLPYAGLTLLLIAASLFGAFTLFEKKDLTYSV